MPRQASKTPENSAPPPTADASFSTIRPFSRSLPMQLLRAREQLMEQFRPHLRAHGITDQQWRVIRALSETSEADMNQLSRLCCISPPSLSRIVPRLESDGLLRRAARAGDQRYTLVSLTDRGRALFRAMAEESVGIYADVIARIGEKEVETLYLALDHLIQAVTVRTADPRTIEEDEA